MDGILALGKAKKYTDLRIEETVRGFRLAGYVSTTAPTGAKKGEYWYESNTTSMPTNFPIQVKEYDGTAWSTTTIGYTPSVMDLWANKNNNKGFYWFGNAWNIIDFHLEVDGTTLDYNVSGQLEIKNGGVAFSKFENNIAVTNAFEIYEDPSVTDKIVTPRAIYMFSRPDNSSLEWDETDGLRVKTEGITFEKLSENLVSNSMPASSPSSSKIVSENAVFNALSSKVSTIEAGGQTLSMSSNKVQIDRVLTKAQYEALTTAEKNNGENYYVTDEETVGAAVLQSTGTSTLDVMSQNAVTTELASKQNLLTAGNNIQINGGTISATDTTYTAGTNIQINGGIISATDTTYTAGTGISITNGVISNTQTSANWGNITGTLSAQTDLQNALDSKLSAVPVATTSTLGGIIVGDGLTISGGTLSVVDGDNLNY